VGSKSSSKTSSTNTTKETNINNVDNRINEGDGSIGGNVNLSLSDTSASGDINNYVTTTDFGAIDTAENIAELSLTESSKSIFEALGVTKEITSSAIESNNSTVEKFGDSIDALGSVAKNALGVASEATRDETAKSLRYAMFAAAAIGVTYVLKKRG